MKYLIALAVALLIASGFGMLIGATGARGRSRQHVGARHVRGDLLRVPPSGPEQTLPSVPL